MKKKEAPKQPGPSLSIQNCTLYGVKWDGKSLEALQALQAVAQALLNLTTLFKSQGMDVPMIQVGDDGPKVNAKP